VTDLFFLKINKNRPTRHYDGGGRDVLPRSLQLIASRTGQEFNQRKNRKEAFWEDRYHAAAIEDGSRTNKPGSRIGSGVKNNPPSFGEPFGIEFFYRLVLR
jgi:hypothetical protein